MWKGKQKLFKDAGGSCIYCVHWNSNYGCRNSNWSVGMTNPVTPICNAISFEENMACRLFRLCKESSNNHFGDASVYSAFSYREDI